MKRKTVNQINIIQPIRTLKKNKSCQLNPKQLRRYFKKSNGRSGGQSITSASVIIDLLLRDLLENLESELRKSEQRKFHQNWFHIINTASSALQNMMDPFPYSGQNRVDNIVSQEEPKTISGDLVCNGNNIASESKASKNQRTSLTLGQYKRQKSQYTAPKQSFSSKCLIKVPQDHFPQRNQGLKALKECLSQDVFEDTLRDKFMKDKKDIYFDRYKFERISKTKVLPSIDEYSFDYDGSVFPIKNNAFQNSQKIKILSTTCKLLNKQAIENRKQCIISRLQGEYIKTEIQENQKQNKKDMPLQKRNISFRRQSNSDSIKDMLKIYTQGDQIHFKNKLQEIICNKAVKIREIKAN